MHSIWSNICIHLITATIVLIIRLFAYIPHVIKAGDNFPSCSFYYPPIVLHIIELCINEKPFTHKMHKHSYVRPSILCGNCVCSIVFAFPYKAISVITYEHLESATIVITCSEVVHRAPVLTLLLEHTVIMVEIILMLCNNGSSYLDSIWGGIVTGHICQLLIRSDPVHDFREEVVKTWVWALVWLFLFFESSVPHLMLHFIRILEFHKYKLLVHKFRVCSAICKGKSRSFFHRCPDSLRGDRWWWWWLSKCD